MTYKVYIAGPMSGRPEFNYPAFHEEAERLRSLGHEVKSPAELGMESSGYGWRECMRRALQLLLDCDIVVVLPGWQDSRGASLEVKIAESLGMRVIPAGLHQEFNYARSNDG